VSASGARGPAGRSRRTAGGGASKRPVALSNALIEISRAGARACSGPPPSKAGRARAQTMRAWRRQPAWRHFPLRRTGKVLRVRPLTP
jgi:hypothetical protein